ncbi:MAG: hypothetical protein AB1445_00185 [Bacillota bacterium]
MTCYVLGVAGTAKNTGKTTVLRALMAEAATLGIAVGLTSIGYDGEDRDHVTGLPKPRVTVPAGTWVATAEAGVRGRSEFSLAVCDAHPVLTALGRVVAARADRPARTVLAGPATARDLSHVTMTLARLGARLVLVDGAFGRLAPMTAVHGLVIATGAARHPEPERVARETGAICQLLALPRWEKWALEKSGNLQVLGPHGAVALRYPALLAPAWGEELARAAGAVAGKAGLATAYVPGSVNSAALSALRRALPAQVKLEVVFSHPLHLLAAGDPEGTAQAIASLAQAGHGVTVRDTVPLLAITVNPFYPAPGTGGEYRAEYVDAGHLLSAIREISPVLVTDVFLDGPAALWQQVWRYAGTAGSGGRAM